jgi:hypothetical protein
MDDSALISALVASYERQLALYEELATVVQKTLSQVILTRGDVSGLMGNFERKQKLLDRILKERADVQPLVVQWQERKAGIPQSGRTMRLDALLSKIQSVIRGFLDNEEQLKKYLEHVVKKGSAVL